MSKLRQQVMRALNNKVGDTSRQTEPIHALWKNSLDDVLDSNINNIVASTIDLNPCLLRQTTSATQLKTPFDVLLPSGLFNEVVRGGDKNSSPSAKKSSSPTFPPNIVPKEPSNLLFRLTGNYNKWRKRKPRVARDSCYITDQSGSQGASALSKSNTNGTESFWWNQT